MNTNIIFSQLLLPKDTVEQQTINEIYIFCLKDRIRNKEDSTDTN